MSVPCSRAWRSPDVAFADWARVEQVSSIGQAEIGARRIYILPTRYGLMFGTLLFLMLLGSVNYVNNPGHLLTFVLAALAANAIYQTWRNLRGLRLVCHGGPPVFSGDSVPYSVELNGAGRARPAIQLMFDDSSPVLVDIDSETRPQRVQLQLQGIPRGLHDPGRLVVSTRYPMGLLCAWCYVACSRPMLVYPKPGAQWTPPGASGDSGAHAAWGGGNDDFAGLRGYRPGDLPSQIDWKSYARERGLNTRMFSGQAATPLWIDWVHAPGGDIESRLSALTRAVLDAEAGGRRYGLRTPGTTIAPGLGPAHRHQCLRHLALYGSGDA